jgi:hypothetical protein
MYSPNVNTSPNTSFRTKNPRELHRMLFQQLPRQKGQRQSKKSARPLAKDISATITALASISLLTKDELKAIDNNTDDPWDASQPTSAAGSANEKTPRLKKRESSNFRRRQSTMMGKTESGSSTDQKELREVRALYALNFARLREETDLLLHRSVRLQMLGADPNIELAQRLLHQLRQLGENMPWRELSIAIVGPTDSGKSALLSRLLGRSAILGNGQTAYNYALVHSRTAPEYSPRLV